jgi:hypothetical protein
MSGQRVQRKYAVAPSKIRAIVIAPSAVHVRPGQQSSKIERCIIAPRRSSSAQRAADFGSIEVGRQRRVAPVDEHLADLLRQVAATTNRMIAIRSIRSERPGASSTPRRRGNCLTSSGLILVVGANPCARSNGGGRAGWCRLRRRLA